MRRDPIVDRISARLSDSEDAVHERQHDPGADPRAAAVLAARGLGNRTPPHVLLSLRRVQPEAGGAPLERRAASGCVAVARVDHVGRVRGDVAPRARRQPRECARRVAHRDATALPGRRRPVSGWIRHPAAAVQRGDDRPLQVPRAPTARRRPRGRSRFRTRVGVSAGGSRGSAFAGTARLRDRRRALLRAVGLARRVRRGARRGRTLHRRSGPTGRRLARTARRRRRRDRPRNRTTSHLDDRHPGRGRGRRHCRLALRPILGNRRRAGRLARRRPGLRAGVASGDQPGDEPAGAQSQRPGARLRPAHRSLARHRQCALHDVAALPGAGLRLERPGRQGDMAARELRADAGSRSGRPGTGVPAGRRSRSERARRAHVHAAAHLGAPSRTRCDGVRRGAARPVARAGDAAAARARRGRNRCDVARRHRHAGGAARATACRGAPRARPPTFDRRVAWSPRPARFTPLSPSPLRRGSSRLSGPR